MKAIHHLKIILKDSSPPIWRRLLVPADFTLFQLHHLIQIAMGWTNSHLHEFSKGKDDGDLCFLPAEVLGRMEEGAGPHESTTLVREILAAPDDTLDYIYDFGDYWEHLIVFEKIENPKIENPRVENPSVENPSAENPSAELSIPDCQDGARACPPEGSGAMPGYADMLEILQDPDHQDYEQTRIWLGPNFDAEVFDLKKTRAAIAGVDWTHPEDFWIDFNRPQ